MASVQPTPTPATDRVAHISQPWKGTVRIRPKAGYDVTVMVGHDVEAYISNGDETVIARLEPPKDGERVVINRQPDGAVDVVYETTKVF